MKKIINLINNSFIKIVLVLFYFFAIGLGFLIYKLTKKLVFNPNSYWKDFSPEQPNLKYFDSPY